MDIGQLLSVCGMRGLVQNIAHQSLSRGRWGKIEQIMLYFFPIGSSIWLRRLRILLEAPFTNFFGPV